MIIKKINSDSIIEDIIETKKEIVVYGAGNYGKTLQTYLYRKYNFTATKFAVTTVKNKEADMECSEDVKTIDEVAKLQMEGDVLIIAIAEQRQEELINIALNLGFSEIYILLNEFYRYMNSELDERRLEPLEKINFEVHIVDHCNLNCKGCYHFSSIAENDFLDIVEFESDIKKMSLLCGENVTSITLLGGEPLLHPQITDFFTITRKYFSKCKVEMLTNGILLNRMDDDFWISCVENNISLSCTKYPVFVDYKEIEKQAIKYNLNIQYHNDIGAGEKTLIKYPFDIRGNQPIKWNYEHCTRSNKCITLKHGRIFTCPMAAHAHIAKEFFDLDIELSDRDSVNIYTAKSFETITEFLTRPIPFCRFCNLKVKPEQMEWSVSQKDIGEWF